MPRYIDVETSKIRLLKILNRIQKNAQSTITTIISLPTSTPMTRHRQLQTLLSRTFLSFFWFFVSTLVGGGVSFGFWKSNGRNLTNANYDMILFNKSTRPLKKQHSAHARSKPTKRMLTSNWNTKLARPEYGCESFSCGNFPAGGR